VSAMWKRIGQIRESRQAFTLIELLVVVAILALLISILLPSLNSARKSGRATVCASNLSQVGKAMATYLAENRGVYPPSYVYASDWSGTWDPLDQPTDPEYGYVHWSWFLFNSGEVQDAAFRCPEIPRGGAPRTNPGPEQADWEAGQIDHFGNSRAQPGCIADKQASRMAFAGNAAIFPRNKFRQDVTIEEEPGAQRVNRFVSEGEIEDTGRTILVTEFHRDWRATAAVVGGGGGAVKSKSHRPVNPFYHLSSGPYEYSAPVNTPGFIYGTTSDLHNYGLVPDDDSTDFAGAINGRLGETELNAVGRHHPGRDRLGGSTNFLYCDGHVARRLLLDTLRNREWGSRYYSLTGANEVVNRYGLIDSSP